MRVRCSTDDVIVNKLARVVCARNIKRCTARYLVCWWKGCFLVNVLFWNKDADLLTLSIGAIVIIASVVLTEKLAKQQALARN